MHLVREVAPPIEILTFGNLPFDFLLGHCVYCADAASSFSSPQQIIENVRNGGGTVGLIARDDGQKSLPLPAGRIRLSDELDCFPSMRTYVLEERMMSFGSSEGWNL
jgi:hypothetical protein